MLKRARSLFLHWLRIPARPEAPWGAPESVRTFRAGQNFYKLRVLRWSLAQLLTLGGIIFWIVLLNDWERRVDAVRSGPQTAPALTVQGETPAAPTGKAKKRSGRGNPAEIFAERSPDWFFPLLRVLELLGLIGYLAQLPVTFALLRLDYELRWYIVTDRSLRIRQGIWRVQESTMSFANLQQVAVTQGPVQRWLKLADVRVQSAGGGAGHESGHQHGDLHTGTFDGVDNATEIRDLILERLRHFRATGLGDPDEATRTLYKDKDANDASLDAANTVLAEVRALRQTLS